MANKTFSGTNIDLTIRCKQAPCDSNDCLVCRIGKLEAVRDAAENLMYGANRIVIAHQERLKDALAALGEKS